MSRTALLCLALFVGSASAWGNWFSKNRETECGKFKTVRHGWFFTDTKTDIDTRQLLSDFKLFDTNKDGFVTFAELLNDTVIRSLDQSMDLVNGVSRCTYVQFQTKHYGISKEVASTIFDMVDLNGDLQLSTADRDTSAPLHGDEDGDGNISICEAFRGHLKLLQAAEQIVYMRELKYTNLVWKFRKQTWWNSLKW